MALHELDPHAAALPPAVSNWLATYYSTGANGGAGSRALASAYSLNSSIQRAVVRLIEFIDVGYKILVSAEGSTRVAGALTHTTEEDKTSDQSCCINPGRFAKRRVQVI